LSIQSFLDLQVPSTYGTTFMFINKKPGKLMSNTAAAW